MNLILKNISERVNGTFAPGLDAIKRRIFGANNERLDFIMDSFYKLTPNQQTGALVGVSAVVAFIVLIAFGVYFSRVNALEDELNTGFEALREIRMLSNEFKQEKDNMDWLMRTVDRKSSSLRPKPFFEQKANQVGVTIEALRSEEVAIAEDNPLSKDFQYVVVDFRMPKVSLPRLLNFVGEIEKSDNTLRVSDLQIRARYGDRLYFEAQAKFTGYKVKRGS